MKTLVIYDSQYGNTEKIARAITEGVGAEASTKLVRDVDPQDLIGVKLLIVGSPTQGGRATPAIQKFVADLPADSLHGMQVAAFDTRFAENEHGIGLKIVMKVLSFAAGRIASALTEKGGVLAGVPQGFIVGEKEGPLKDGEIERAVAWGKKLTT